VLVATSYVWTLGVPWISDSRVLRTFGYVSVRYCSALFSLSQMLMPIAWFLGLIYEISPAFCQIRRA